MFSSTHSQTFNGQDPSVTLVNPSGNEFDNSALQLSFSKIIISKRRPFSLHRRVYCQRREADGTVSRQLKVPSLRCGTPSSVVQAPF